MEMLLTILKASVITLGITFILSIILELLKPMFKTKVIKVIEPDAEIKKLIIEALKKESEKDNEDKKGK